MCFRQAAEAGEGRMKDMPLEEIRTGPLPSRDPSGGREDLCSPPDSLVLPFRCSERLLDL